MKSLIQLYDAHSGKVSDKWQAYLPHYDRLFESYRMTPIRLLEIGIQNGGSLEIWSEYFQNAEKIIGCDIDDNCANLRYENTCISVVVEDANSRIGIEKINKISSEFDLIIDDGSHKSSDIIKSFFNYFSNIVDGGMFIAEDLHCSYWEVYEGGLYHPYSSIAFFKYLADIVNYEHWGIEKSRASFLNGFETEYDRNLVEDVLSQIHSVEFVNSICIVRKKHAQNNILGLRIISGKDEDVVSGRSEVHGFLSDKPDQSNNYWSNLSTAPAELFISKLDEISNLQNEISNLQKKLSETGKMNKSQFIAPFRAFVHGSRDFLRKIKTSFKSKKKRR